VAYSIKSNILWATLVPSHFKWKICTRHIWFMRGQWIQTMNIQGKNYMKMNMVVLVVTLLFPAACNNFNSSFIISSVIYVLNTVSIKQCKNRYRSLYYSDQLTILWFNVSRKQQLIREAKYFMTTGNTDKNPCGTVVSISFVHCIYYIYLLYFKKCSVYMCSN
jgi:hypothetical protein